MEAVQPPQGRWRGRGAELGRCGAHRGRGCQSGDFPASAYATFWGTAHNHRPSDNCIKNNSFFANLRELVRADFWLRDSDTYKKLSIFCCCNILYFFCGLAWQIGSLLSKVIVIQAHHIFIFTCLFHHKWYVRKNELPVFNSSCASTRTHIIFTSGVPLNISLFNENSVQEGNKLKPIEI